MVVTVTQQPWEQILKNPPNGGLAVGLDELRYKILIEGIPSNNDGMVRFVDCQLIRPSC